MIATLFKHEIRRTWRWFGLIVLVGLLVTGSATIVALLLPAPLNSIFTVLALIAAMAVVGVVPVWLGIDFYRSSYSKTGYLTRALPVKGSKIYWVKLGNAYLLCVLAIVASLALAYLAGIGFAVVSGGTVAELNESLRVALETLGNMPFGVVALIVAVVLILPLQWLASYFVAATVGSEAWSVKLGLGGPILVWFGFYTASQIVGILGAFLPLHVVVEQSGARLLTEWINVFTVDAQNIVPVGVFIAMLVLALAGLVWASVSFDKKVELR